ncbi:MAG: hypothetical protein ACOH2N_14900 [Devosia sp.]
MSKPTKAKPPKSLSFEQAVARLPKEQSKREALLGVYQQVHADYHAAHDQLAISFKALSLATDDVARNRTVIDRLRGIVDLGPAPAAAQEKEVDAPLMTDAEFLHQKETNPEIKNVGKSKALFCMDEFIGGFSRYPNREDHHEQAAARYLSLYERAQIGGARATDYSMPLVDRSGPGEDIAMVVGEDARREFAGLKMTLGAGRAGLLEAVIVGRTPARRIAAHRADNDDVTGRAVAEVAQQVKDALEAAAAYFGFRPRLVSGEHYVDKAFRDAREKAMRQGRRNKLNA